MDVPAIRAALADLLATGLTDWHVEPRIVESPNLPALLVGLPDTATYRATIGGQTRLDITIEVLVGRVSYRAAQERLDTAISTGVAGSVIDILDGAIAPTSGTGREWRALRVVSAGDLRAVTVGTAVDILAASIDLELLA